MHLLIRAVSLAGQPLTQALSAYFDERGGTMGRSDTNTLALPDPERRISRLQAEVARVPEGWRLQNVGHANPLWHNNKPVGPGESVLLDEGDELQVGSYALQVSYSTDATARTITEGRSAVDARTVIAVLTHDPKFDVPAIKAALATPAGYIGAMGSRRTHEDRLTRLREAGVTDDELARVHSPIGLDLGARTPEETAVSIAAEIIQSRWGGTGRHLAATDGPIHPDAPR